MNPNGLRWSKDGNIAKIKKGITLVVGKAKVTLPKYLEAKNISSYEWMLQHGFVLKGEVPSDEEGCEFRKACRAAVEDAVPKVKPLKTKDLFSGVGGLSIGLRGLVWWSPSGSSSSTKPLPKLSRPTTRTSRFTMAM